MERIFVVPGKDLKVPYPDNPKLYLPSTGAFVTNSIYWIRRLNERGITVQKNEVTSTKTDKKFKGGK